MGPIEKALAGVFKNAPALPKGFKDWLVKYLPWLTIIAAAGSAWAAYGAWHWAHAYQAVSDWINAWSTYYGGTAVSTTRMGAGLWIIFIVMIVMAVVYLAAYAGLQAKKKAGWNMLFLASFVGLLGGIVSLFTDYSPAGNFVGALIGAVVSWYVLFQIRDSYTGGKAVAPKAPEVKE